jgi:hypothetical protein
MAEQSFVPEMKIEKVRNGYVAEMLSWPGLGRERFIYTSFPELMDALTDYFEMGRYTVVVEKISEPAIQEST